MLKKVLILIFIINSSFLFSQQRKIDSLKSVLTSKLSSKKRLKVLDTLNQILINSKTPDESIDYFEEMAQLSKEINNISLETKAYRYLSESFMRKNDFSKAVLFANKALSIDDSLQLVNPYLVDINQLGRVYYHFQDIDKAIEIYNKGVKLYNEKTEGKAISTIYGNLGIAYAQQEQEKKSIDCYIKEAELAEKYNDITQKSSANYLIAYTYMGLEQFEKAEKYYFKSLKDSLLIPLKVYVYRNYHGLGIMYSRWKKYEKALQYNKKALDFFSKAGNKLFEFDILNNIAVVYLRKKNYIKATEYAKKALEIANKLDYKLAQNGANSTLVNILLQTKDYDKADRILRNMAKDTIDTKSVNREMKIDVYENFYIINKGKKRYKKALSYLERQKELSDSLIKRQRDNKIAKIETTYEALKKEKEIAQQNQVILQKEMRQQKMKYLIAFLMVVVAILLILFINYYRRYRKKNYELNTTIQNVTKLQKRLFETQSIRSEIQLNTIFSKKEFTIFLMKKYAINKYEIIDVWESIANGMSRNEYAKERKISENTIKYWRKELYTKLKKATFIEGRYSDYKAVVEYYNSLRWYEFHLKKIG